MALKYQMPPEAYEKLSEEDKEFYHNTLPWLLMAVGVSGICEESIEHIRERNSICPILSKMPTKEYLMKFEGMTANVYFETNSEFLKRLGRRLPKGTSKDIDKVRQILRKVTV